jgi:hypothetical protein
MFVTGTNRIKARLLSLVCGLLVLTNLLPPRPALASTPVAECPEGDATAVSLAINDPGDDTLYVVATARRASEGRDPVQVEVLQEVGPDENKWVAGGTALLDGSGQALIYASWLSRSALGLPGDSVSVHAHFTIPREPDRTSCSVSFTV